MPKTRNVGCTKGVDRQMKASGFNPSRGPGCVLHATGIIKEVRDRQVFDAAFWGAGAWELTVVGVRTAREAAPRGG